MIQLQVKVKPCERRLVQVSAKYKIATFGQNYDKVWEENSVASKLVIYERELLGTYI